MCTDITKAKWVSSLLASPPAHGWWAASYMPGTYKRGYRKESIGFSWYNGKWSSLYSPVQFVYDSEEKGYLLKDRAIPDTLSIRALDTEIFYCDYWPENPRVPRPFKTKFENGQYVCI